MNCGERNIRRLRRFSQIRTATTRICENLRHLRIIASLSRRLDGYQFLNFVRMGLALLDPPYHLSLQYLPPDARNALRRWCARRIKTVVKLRRSRQRRDSPRSRTTLAMGSDKRRSDGGLENEPVIGSGHEVLAAGVVVGMANAARRSAERFQGKNG